MNQGPKYMQAFINVLSLQICHSDEGVLHCYSWRALIYLEGMLPEITVNWLWLNSWESGQEIYVCLFWLPSLRGLATIQRTEIIWVEWVLRIPIPRIAYVLQLDTLSYKWGNWVSLVIGAIRTLCRDHAESTHN